MHLAGPLEKKAHFRYKARAAGLLGHLDLPKHHHLEPQAGVELPEDGGYVAKRVEDFRLDHIVSFDAAHASVTGAYDPEDNAFFTVVTAAVEDLDILGVIRARRIIARLTSKASYVHPSLPSVEPSFVPIGSHIDGLVIAGHPVTVKLHVGAFCGLDTYTEATGNRPDSLEAAFVGNHNGTLECSL